MSYRYRNYSMKLNQKVYFDLFFIDNVTIFSYFIKKCEYLKFEKQKIPDFLTLPFMCYSAYCKPFEVIEASNDSRITEIRDINETIRYNHYRYIGG